MKFDIYSRLPLFMAENGDGGGGGSGDGGPSFGELASGTEASEAQGKEASDFLSKQQGFDAKSIEGKSHTEVWNIARETQERIRNPFKGTPFEGHKVPAKFVKDGKVDVGNMLKGYGELETAFNRRKDDFKKEVESEFLAALKAKAPASPQDYTLSATKAKFKNADGTEREAPTLKIGDREIELLEDHPATKFMREMAHKYGIPNEDFHGIVSGYLTANLAAGPKWSEESKALGGEALAEKREARVNGFLKANLSEENYAFFARMPSTAASIKAVEELMTLSGHPPFIPEKGDIPGEKLSLEELRQMQRDPRYTGEGPGGVDKAFVAKVRAGFRSLSK